MTSPKTDALLVAIRRAVSTLDLDQGPIARRNARARVAKALRKLRHALDKDYAPPPRALTKKLMDKASVAARQRRRMRQLEDAGWVTYPTDMSPARMAVRRALLLGVRVHVWKSGPSSGKGTPQPEECVTAPSWLITAKDDAHAKRLAGSRKLREAWDAELALSARAARDAPISQAFVDTLSKMVTGQTFRNGVFLKPLLKRSA